MLVWVIYKAPSGDSCCDLEILKLNLTEAKPSCSTAVQIVGSETEYDKGQRFTQVDYAEGAI